MAARNDVSSASVRPAISRSRGKVGADSRISARDFSNDVPNARCACSQLVMGLVSGIYGHQHQRAGANESPDPDSEATSSLQPKSGRRKSLQDFANVLVTALSRTEPGDPMSAVWAPNWVPCRYMTTPKVAKRHR
jgi:hypothetical protein